jgi:hypothetical protein
VVEAIGGHDLTDAVVRVVLRLRAEQETLLQEREVLRALQSAYYIAGLSKDIERPERQRLGAISVEALPPAELLARYLEVRNVTPERARALLEAAEQIMVQEL